MIRADPNRTLIPGLIVDAVVVEPWGAHPSYAQGYYDRDNDFYVRWEAISRDPARLQALPRRVRLRRAPTGRSIVAPARPGLTGAAAGGAIRCAPGVNYGF